VFVGSLLASVVPVINAAQTSLGGNASSLTEGVAYTYNGRNWSLTEVAQPRYGSLLDGVYCAAPSSPSCVVVGLRFSGYLVPFATPAPIPYGLIEEYKGHSWVRPSEPALAGRLMSVGCSPSVCLAVGVNEVGQADRGIAIVKDANGWVIDKPTGLYGRYPLWSVSCGLRTQCVAVGDDGNSNGTVILTWKHGWSSLAAPEMPLPAGLVGVSCASQEGQPLCVAVGYEQSRPSGSTKTLILQMS
jgi:hypothetical protein